jgi:hypothetical protein
LSSFFLVKAVTGSTKLLVDSTTLRHFLGVVVFLGIRSKPKGVTMELKAENVDKLFRSLLFTKEEVDRCTTPPTAIIVEGILAKFGLHPERVKEAEVAISSLLDQLPDEFKFDGETGGSSFLRACFNKNGEQWADHRNMEQLFVMGLAIKRVKYYVPRELWGAFPGSMPILMVLEKPREGSDYLVPLS